ncbi:MAG: caspase family protein, partial [Alphaproteobacteria bacterium]|nr:caspase family protein [Alphaproteobacteria bacterium]
TNELQGVKSQNFKGHTWNGNIVSKEYYCQQAKISGMQSWGMELFDKKGCNNKNIVKIKDENLFNWYALAKHPKTNFEFIATRVSNKEDAKKIAIKKCYNFVSKKLNKLGYNDCYIDLIFDKNNNYQLAEKITLKQENQKNRIAQKNLSNQNYKKKITNELQGVKSQNFKGHTWNGNIVSKNYYCQEALKAGMPNWGNELYREKGCYEISKTQIAKAEPSQTQKVIKRNNHLIKPNKWVYFVNLENRSGVNASIKYDSSFFLNNKKNMNKYFFDTNEKLFKYIRNKNGKDQIHIRISEKAHNLFFNKTDISLGESRKILSSIKSYKPKILKDLIDEYTEDNESKEDLLAYFNQKQPIITPKKKTKIAKVEEPKQEEFKPKKTNQDNEAPVIEIAEAITVNDTSYILEGRVTDKADKIFVEIDGQPVQVKKGKFKVKRYSPVDEQIKIVAIDQWGNKSKTKLINITIDIDETIVANKLEPLNPSNISNKSSNNKVALIIGIENYTEAPKANYANLDAKYFFDYARRAFGVKKQNINLLVNEEATVVKTDKALSLWLKSKIKKNRSDLIIFFAGHGLASSDGKELYLLPQDGNPDRLERTALSRTDLFKEIISLNPKSVTMFLDTCYSGVSRDEQMLLASARPIRIVADEQEGIPDNFTIFSASQLDQISSGLKEANHGIFSYYLMKGLEGKADSNQDKKITNGELLAYMDENISQKAAEQGREQNPSLAGDPEKILISYR